MAPVEELTIGEVAHQTGLRTSALRYYESIGLLTPTRRINGHRRYDAAVVSWLHFIQVAQWLGCSLDELRILFHAGTDHSLSQEAWQNLVEQKLAQVEQFIDRAQRMKALLEQGRACGCLKLEDCVLVATRELTSRRNGR